MTASDAQVPNFTNIYMRQPANPAYFLKIAGSGSAAMPCSTLQRRTVATRAQRARSTLTDCAQCLLLLWRSTCTAWTSARTIQLWTQLPVTDALARQKQAALNSVQSWWLSCA